MATSKIYGISEAAITWSDSGSDHVITLQNLAATTGMRQGAVHDFNLATAKAIDYAWRFWCQHATAPVAGEYIDIRWKSGDGTHYDNDDGTGDIAVSHADKLRNTKFLGRLQVDEAVQDKEISMSGLITIVEEEGMPIICNKSADNLKNTANTAGFSLTPIVRQAQAT